MSVNRALLSDDPLDWHSRLVMRSGDALHTIADESTDTRDATSPAISTRQSIVLTTEQLRWLRAVIGEVLADVDGIDATATRSDDAPPSSGRVVAALAARVRTIAQSYRAGTVQGAGGKAAALSDLVLAVEPLLAAVERGPGSPVATSVTAGAPAQPVDHDAAYKAAVDGAIAAMRGLGVQWSTEAYYLETASRDGRAAMSYRLSQARAAVMGALTLYYAEDEHASCARIVELQNVLGKLAEVWRWL